MKSPINSFADDFGIAFEDEKEREYSAQHEKAKAMMTSIHLSCHL